MKTAEELFNQLNAQDESIRIEAKTASAIDKSILETVCAYTNEPGLDGGYLLLGVSPGTGDLFPRYEVVGIEDPDKIQSDLASQCTNQFNAVLRPEIQVDELEDKIVLVVLVHEQDESAKPVYFKSQGLPGGAFRRIGTTDQRCTEDDLMIFYQEREGYDSSALRNATLKDIDPAAIDRYRSLRKNVNPYASELEFDNTELLEALGCIKDNSITIAGILLFGKRQALRRILPMIRVDYIRVPGNEWIKEPDERFTTIDMRGSLLEMVNRAVAAVNDDLPKGFLLQEESLQAQSIGLPTRALREAIVNALMHRSYRTNRPIQIIRYNNRLEIINPGYSLKPEDRLGEPGSEVRNPFIAAVFHETNLAETKGSGIRAMRRALENAGMAPPTFESNREENTFTARLLLHHFLSTGDLQWLSLFGEYELSDSQKRGLIFVREVGAIDNGAYRQLSDIDVLKASNELRDLRDREIIRQKGKGRSTYYVPGKEFERLSTPVQNQGSAPVESVSSARDSEDSTPAQNGDSAPVQSVNTPASLKKEDLPENLHEKLEKLGRRANRDDMEEFLVILCQWRETKLKEMADLLDREPKYLLQNYIQNLMKDGKLTYTIPDMPNHPRQAYKTTQSGKAYLKRNKN